MRKSMRLWAQWRAIVIQTRKNMEQTNKPESTSHFGRYLFVGFLTVAPLWVTWLVFDFLLELLANVGAPVLLALAGLLQETAPKSALWMQDGTLHQLVAVLVTLGVLYGIGIFTSLLLGKRIVSWLESLVGRLPLVQTIYGGTKRFLQSVSAPPATGQRVVLISFPTPRMKAVGFLTTVMKDQQTNQDLAVVYVPTAPNPTSGYIEIVPLEDVVQTDWTVEQAMTFVMTAGATAPSSVSYSSAPSPAVPTSLTD